MIMMLAVSGMQARKRRSTRGNIGQRAVAETRGALPADSFIIPDSAQLSLYGYDKPLRSRRETLFISNNTGHDINAVSLSIQYIDSKGRRFHDVSRRVRADIPAGSTRCVDFPSWDTQQSFYYVGSRRPRSAGTPYDVRISADTVFVSLNDGR